MDAIQLLKKYFGYDSFRPGQEEMVTAILEGRDALAIMPTGAGKSICYQLPALALPGVTLVISPLISLMQDQVKALNAAGISAAYINSSLTESQISKALYYAGQERYKIIYAAPERLMSEEFQAFAASARISMITVDEAHCISQWGQDFRPSYLKIAEFIGFLPYRPRISAFTATATGEVKDDIVCSLGMENPKVLVTGFDRANLFFRVENIRNKDSFILKYLDGHPEESGIIYCATRKNVDKLYELLLEHGTAVSRYHAGLDPAERKKNQDDFIYDVRPIIVATNAFGMGIDKSNVRFVIHYNMPQNMENYYQEAGRAGRDGAEAQCILLFSAQDVVIDKFLLERKDFSGMDAENAELLRRRDAQRLHQMEYYCHTPGCLRNYILEYFGERTAQPCGYCSNCQKEFTEIDMTFEAKWIINCVAETRGRYGTNVVTGTLLGANRAKLTEYKTTEYKSYGMLKGRKEETLKMLISQMIEEGYLVQSDDAYSLLRMGKEVRRLHDESVRVMLKVHEEEKEAVTETSKSAQKRKTDALTSAGFELFEELRQLRLEIAKEEKMPPYIIFSDKTLIDMCVKFPRGEAEMMKVSGVGENKYQKYGQRFLEAIAKFAERNPEKVTAIGADEEQEEAEAVKSVKKKRKNQKQEFSLTAEQAEHFTYAEKYYVSELKDELNRLIDTEVMKKVSTTPILDFFKEEGLITEKQVNGVWKKFATEYGAAEGIETVKKVSKAGMPYELLVYPENVQKMAVDYFVGLSAED